VPDKLRDPVLNSNLQTTILGIRPLYMQAVNGQVPEANGNVCAGTVYVYERLGTKGVLTVTVGQQKINVLTPIEMSFKIDDTVDVAIDSENITVFDPQTRRNLLLSH
jgi:ABC-type sugar transport system ATPase subunit